MNLTLNHESKPYEETKTKINSLLSSFNKFIINNYQPNQKETNEIMNQWKALEQKLVNKNLSPEKKKMSSPSNKNIMSPTQALGNRSDSKPQLGADIKKQELKRIARMNLSAISKNNKEIFGVIFR